MQRSQPPRPDISDEEFADWRLHPVTRAFFEHLAELRLSLMEQFAAGAFVEDTEFKTALAGGSASATCQFIQELRSCEADTINPRKD